MSRDKKSTILCLGKSFESDEARKEYFREELKKKLPELKNIEGFPIGEDDDIIALSDPPYYTVCPNPWLNDFIAEWEKEKKSSKDRINDFHVSAPYASDVSEGKTNQIYAAHSYHTKVPHPAIMRYILHYTQPGDIVLDGFAGTGMTAVAAISCENPDIENKFKIESEWKSIFNSRPKWGSRKAIIGDLSPIASFIAYNYTNPVDLEDYEKEFKNIITNFEKQLGWMYETKHTNGK
jgi:DNA methylase